MTTILSTWRFTPAQLDVIAAAAPGHTVRQQTAVSSAEVDDALGAHPDTEILYTGIPPHIEDPPPALRWIQLHSAGTDAAETAPMWHWPVAVTSGSGITSIAVAEMTLAGVLALHRRLPRTQELAANAIWPADRLALAGTELYRSTAVIAGYGSVGRAVGRLLHAFGVRLRVAVPDPGRTAYTGYTAAGSGDPAGSLPESWHRLDDLPDLLPDADLVVLCLPRMPRPLIGTAELAAMRASALLVNVGRGPLVDGDALLHALEHETLAGAYLDVTDPEPLPSTNALWHQPRCLITPHLAGTTEQVGRHGADLLTTNLARHHAGQPLLNVIRGRSA